MGSELLAVLVRLQFDLSASADSSHAWDGYAYSMYVLVLWAYAMLGSLILTVGLVLQYRAGTPTSTWEIGACIALLLFVILTGGIAGLIAGAF